MKFINKFSNYHKFNEEVSKNDPIPELTRMDSGLGIILLGTPGSGKSTFAKNYIYPHNRNIKDFSTDDVSFRFTGDVKKHYPSATELNLQYLSNYMETGQNFIYDTTGSNAEGVYRVYRKAKKLGYKVIFILMLIDLETSKKQNLMRGEMGGHMADDDYVDFVYQRQFHTTKDYLNILKPDEFYVVLNKNGKYKFYKFDKSGELLKRKVDKYVSFIKESVSAKDVVDDIVETMIDFIDEGEKITFKSATGDMTYGDYLEKNSKYDNFKPVITARGTTTSKFSIVYSPKDGSYNGLMIVMENMKSTIGRLGEYGWVLSAFRAGSDGSWSNERYGRGKEVKIDWAYFEFTKPYQKIDTDEVELPDEDELRQQIESFGIGIERLSIGDYETELDFYSNSYDGALSSEQFYDDRFEEICDIFGFQSYDLDYRRSKVIFEH
jgi:predicted ABC-type ATPase